MHDLVELQKISPQVVQEILYATPHNFTGQTLYSLPCCFLQRPVAQRLGRVQAGLQKKGLGLKIFDGYRPLSVQRICWDLVPDPRYVADPRIGSKHNRGAAVDVTLVDRKGAELSMPSAFDDFTEKAHRDYAEAPQETLRNRQILEEAMVLEGFIPLSTEWWHFDDPEWETYPLLDLSFEELLR